MNIDAATFHAIADTILGDQVRLSAGEAAAIVKLGYLTSAADFEEDTEELDLRAQLHQYVCTLAGIDPYRIARPSPLPLPIDDEARHAWLVTLCNDLVTTGGRELAYVVVYLLAAGDFELAPAESTLLAELQKTLGIADDRARELVGHATEQMTPGTTLASPDSHASDRSFIP
jgi:hypothetical protein